MPKRLSANGVVFFDAAFARAKFNGTNDAFNSDDFPAFTKVQKDGNNIVEFTIPAANVTNKSVKYFAICCTGISDESIITINEPIE